MISRRHKGLLDRSRRGPAEQVPNRAGLVIRSRRAAAAKRLLSDDGAGRLVIDIEVAGGETQRAHCLVDGEAIGREDGPGQGIRRRRLELMHRRTPRPSRISRVVVDMHREDRPEVFVREYVVRRVRGLDDCRPDEEANTVIGLTAGQDVRRGLAMQPINDAAEPVECPPVDHGAAEVREVTDVAVRQRLGQRDQLVPYRSIPQRLRHVRARRSGALLVLVLERTAHESNDQGRWLRRWMGEHEVLATSFADKARVGRVRVDRAADRPPKTLIGNGRAAEVDACQSSMTYRDLTHGHTITGHEIDHAGRQARCFEQSHRPVRGKLLGRRRFPYDNVSQQRRRGRQVAGNRREIERGDRQDESFKRSVVRPVPR